MKHSRNKEYNDHCICFGNTIFQERVINMSDEPEMDWQIPKSPIFIQIFAIPPILLKKILMF